MSDIRTVAFVATASVCILAAFAAGCRREAGEVPSTRPAASPPAASKPAEGVAADVCRAALAWFDKAIASDAVGKMVPAAEAAAERFIAGGSLLAAGNGGFADEMFYRAGGFPFTYVWREELPDDNDVVVIGLYRPDADGFEWSLSGAKAREDTFGRAMIVHFAGHGWPLVKSLVRRQGGKAPDARLHMFDTGAPAGKGIEAECVGQLATTALAWAFHGEVIAAATRKGKMLATFASDWEPDGLEWDQSVLDHHVHPTCKVPPIAAGEIGTRYLKACRQQVADFLATQIPQVRLAAGRLAHCLKRGGRVWLVSQGHIHARGSTVPPALPRVINAGREGQWRWESGDADKGDVVVWMGYLRYPADQAEDVLRIGADLVSISVDAGVNDERRVHIFGCWKDYDTVVELPKYPIRVLPSSGVVQTAQWYAILGEALAAYRGEPSATAPAPDK